MSFGINKNPENGHAKACFFQTLTNLKYYFNCRRIFYL